MTNFWNHKKPTSLELLEILFIYFLYGDSEWRNSKTTKKIHSWKNQTLILFLFQQKGVFKKLFI
jgi:hypothetical protein